MSEKPLFWVGSSLEDVREFPAIARQRVGHALHLVQLGLEPPDWKPMPSVGIGIREIRVHTELEHRVVYVAKFAEAVYVLHAFEKRSRATSRRDLDLARARLSELVQWRREHASSRREERE